MFSAKRKRQTILLLLISLFFWISPVHGKDNFGVERVQINVSSSIRPQHIIANADFYQGKAGKGAIVILHGFLLTHNFHTVKRLAESLYESGYTVLTPTLSLGINKRVKTLACEAIHTHSLGMDISELNLWVKWLEKRSKGDITLIGHSAGSLHSVAYLNSYPPDRIKHVIFISMPNFGPGLASYETELHAETAEALIKKGDQKLHEFGLSYCKKYTTTAKSFLSYYQLSQKNTYQYLQNISINKSLIFGTEDKRIDHQWNVALGRLEMNIIIIESANHFFDYEHEFDLLDNIENILSEIY